MGNLSNPSINRWGTSLMWFNVLKTVSRRKQTIQQALFIQRFSNLFLQGGVTDTKHLLTRIPFKFVPITVQIKPKEEPWYVRRYFRRLKFRSSFIDEDLPYFERRFNSKLYVGQIKVLNFKDWTLVLISTLRTFSRFNLPRVKRWKKRKFKVSPFSMGKMEDETLVEQTYPQTNYFISNNLTSCNNIYNF